MQTKHLPTSGNRMLLGPEVMKRLRYSSPAAFYEFVRKAGVPHIVLNPRRIVFPERALEEWLQNRSVGLDPRLS